MRFQRSLFPRCAASPPSRRFVLPQPGHLLRPMALVFWIQKLTGRFGGRCWNCCFSIFISWYGDVWIITNQSASLKLQGYFMGSSTSSLRVRMPWIHAMIPTVLVLKPRIWFHCRIGLGSFGLPCWEAQKRCWKPHDICQWHISRSNLGSIIICFIFLFCMTKN